MIRTGLQSGSPFLSSPHHQGLLSRHGQAHVTGMQFDWPCRSPSPPCFSAYETLEGRLPGGSSSFQPRCSADCPKPPPPFFSKRAGSVAPLGGPAASQSSCRVDLPLDSSTARACCGSSKGSVCAMAFSSDEQTRQQFVCSSSSDKKQPRANRGRPHKVLSVTVSVPLDDDLIEPPKPCAGESHTLLTVHSTTIDRYKKCLKEYVALRSELQTWCEFFLSRYKRRPTLGDAESTQIPWLASKFRLYVAVREKVEAQAKTRPRLAVMYVDARRKSLHEYSPPIQTAEETREIVMNAADLWIDGSMLGMGARDGDGNGSGVEEEEGKEGDEAQGEDHHGDGDEVAWHTVGRPVLGWARKAATNRKSAHGTWPRRDDQGPQT